MEVVKHDSLEPHGFLFQILSQLFKAAKSMNLKPWLESKTWPLIQQKKTSTMYHPLARYIIFSSFLLFPVVLCGTAFPVV